MRYYPGDNLRVVLVLVLMIALLLLGAMINGFGRGLSRHDLVLEVDLDPDGETYSAVVQSARRFDFRQICGEPVTGRFAGGAGSYSLTVECPGSEANKSGGASP